MGLLSNILIKIKTKHWTIFFYVVHVLGLACALSLIAISYLAFKAENDTVGDFELDLTFNVSVMFYVASSLILLNAVIGLLAQVLPDRPSLWILYCIVLAILSVVVLTASVSATSKSKTANYPVARMKLTMEDYDDTADHKKPNPKAKKWDDLHKKYKCCGTEGYKDWQDVHFGRTSLRVPISCCLPKLRNDTLCGLNVLPHDDHADRRIHSRGCLKPALQQVQNMLTLLSVMGLSVSATHLLLATLSCYLVVTKKI